MLIRNRKSDNIVVAKTHSYTVDKVKKAMEFINSSGRNTSVEDWVNIYNFIKGTNESASGCKACAAAKYTAGVRNYAKYGYLTLLNEGHTPDEFGIGKKKVAEVENKEERINGVEPLIEVIEEEEKKEEVIEKKKTRKTTKKNK